jgi:hypothetical protein
MVAALLQNNNIMKHVLIPTDFTVDSLNAVHAAISIYEDEQLVITLFHLLAMPNDISDLLYKSRRRRHEEMVTEEYNEALQVLQNRNSSRFKSIRIKFGFGNTVAYLQNLLEGEKVDRVLLCPDIKLIPPSARSIDMIPLLNRTGITIDNIPTKNVRKNMVDIGVINMMIGNELKVPKKEKGYVIEK